MTTLTRASLPTRVSTREFNEGVRFFLMHARLNLGTALAMNDDAAHQGLPLDSRCLALIGAIAQDSMKLLDMGTERVPK